MPRAPRILVLNERDPRHPRAGGAEVHVAEIFRRLAERGLEVTLAASSFQESSEQEEWLGLRVERLGRLPLYYPRVAAFCERETRRERFDGVVECLNKVPFFSPLYSRKPVLALCHHLFGETAFEQVPWAIAATVWGAERLVPPLYRHVPFVTISDSSRDDLVRRGVDPSRITVSRPGITPPAAESLPLAKRAMRVTYLGRLEPYKRVDLLLRAMAHLAERSDLEIVIIGRGSAQESLKRLARELGLGGRTRFTGFVDDAERDALLAASRVCVFPSTKEGWGLTVIEANALGTPVVGSDAPGLRDSIRAGETGFLEPPGDAAAFGRSIERLLGDDALWERLSTASLDWSRQFTWDRAADEMGEALERLLG